MAETDKGDIEMLNEAVTYIFNTEDMVKADVGIKTRIWQILPCVCASLMCVPYGLMLGWPSPTYPKLFQPASPIPITSDQSAMIAGFLMIGSVLGTPFSSSYFVEPKYGLLIGTGLMTCGWIVMWQARDIFWLLGSRLLVGFGHGYGFGQLKNYINDMCDAELRTLLVKQAILYTFFSVIVIYSFGSFTNFEITSEISLIISIFIFFLMIFLPSTPRELIKGKKIKHARKLLALLKPGVNINDEINKITQNVHNVTKEYSLMKILRNNVLRNNFFIFLFIVFCQQFSGAPATIIYSQILFELSRSSHPIFSAIGYSVIYFFANIFGIFIAPKYNKKNVLLFSSFTVSLLIVAKLWVIHFAADETYWSYTSVVVMYMYIILHTVGLGNIPVTLIPDLFPKNCQTLVSHVFIMFYCTLALVITKIFQVMVKQLNFASPFYLFLCTSLTSFIFVLIFLPRKIENTENTNEYPKD